MSRKANPSKACAEGSHATCPDSIEDLGFCRCECHAVPPRELEEGVHGSEEVATLAMYVALIHLSFQSGGSWTLLRAMIGPLIDAAKAALVADLPGDVHVQVEQPLPEDYLEWAAKQEDPIPDHLPEDFS